MVGGKRLYDGRGSGIGQRDWGERVLVCRVEGSQAMKEYEKEEEMI